MSKMSTTVGWCLAILLITGRAAAEEYQQERIFGWQVNVESAFRQQHPELYRAVMAELHGQLHEITRKVPAGALDKLREVPVWVHYQSKTACMAYHPSERWLREHEFPPAMAKGVEIGNAANFLQWTRDQPWMVLHELSHAYHDRVLGFDEARIRGAYEAAKAAGNYEKVLQIRGRRERHYALMNAKEYFAEASEAYFGTNDFYPFVRAELREFDFRMFTLLGQIWGER